MHNKYCGTKDFKEKTLNAVCGNADGFYSQKIKKVRHLLSLTLYKQNDKIKFPPQIKKITEKIVDNSSGECYYNQAVAKKCDNAP